MYVLMVQISYLLYHQQDIQANNQDINFLPKLRNQQIYHNYLLKLYANMEELIRIGAYRAGADPLIDRAIALNPAIEAFLGQGKDDATSLEASFDGLDQILNGAAA